MMPYWNDHDCKGLADVGAVIEDDPTLTGFAKYCRLHARGNTQDAMKALSRFIDEVGEWPAAARREFVDWLLTTQHHHPEIEHLIPRPLQVEVVDPTLAEIPPPKMRDQRHNPNAPMA